MKRFTFMVVVMFAMLFGAMVGKAFAEENWKKDRDAWSNTCKSAVDATISWYDGFMKMDPSDFGFTDEWYIGMFRDNRDFLIDVLRYGESKGWNNKSNNISTLDEIIEQFHALEYMMTAMLVMRLSRRVADSMERSYGNR